MRPHTTTDNPRAAASTGTKRTILALSLAVALLGATASTASTTPTAPPPLTLSFAGWAHVVGPGYGASRKDKLLRFGVIVSNDSRLVARGSKIEKAATQGGANLDPCPEGWDDHVPGQVFGECCSKALAGCMSSIRRIEAKLKHRKRLYRKPRFKAKIEVTATDEFGQTTSDEVKFLLRRCPKTIRMDGPDQDREALYAAGTRESCAYAP